MKPIQAFKFTASVVLVTSLTACGGGGGYGDAGVQPPTVALSSTSSVKYSESMLITLTGSRLDQTLTLTSAGCRNFVRSTSAPNVSSATTAYYTCTVAGAVGNQTVTVAGGGANIASVAFTVPVPQVSMVISNGPAGAGTLVITLSPDLAPLTVDNFLAYVKAGFYNGVAFHRHGRFDNLGTFVLQAGAYPAPLTSGAAFPAHKPVNAAIALEAGRGLSNKRYTLAMARSNAADSATSEFFINTVDNLFLDTSGGGYAVFGSVTTNTTMVDTMAGWPCNLSPVNFNSTNPLTAPSVDCLPEPNLIITNALQTR